MKQTVLPIAVLTGSSPATTVSGPDTAGLYLRIVDRTGNSYDITNAVNQKRYEYRGMVSWHDCE